MRIAACGLLLVVSALILQGCATVQAADHTLPLALPDELRIVIGTNWKLDLRHRVAFENSLHGLITERLEHVRVTTDRTAPYLSFFVHVIDARSEINSCGEIAYVVDAAYTERVRIRRPGRDPIGYVTLWHEIAPNRATPAELEQSIRRDVQWLVARFVAGPVDSRVDRPVYIGAPPPIPFDRNL